MKFLSAPKKILFGAVIVSGVALGIFIIIHPATHAASLIPVSLIPVTTLAAETSNNTSAANNFPGWSDGDEAAGNVSKVNIHTLLYPGNTTKVFTLVEPWFCVNSPGEISDSNSNQCGSHLQVGYSEDTTAQVNGMVGDMMSRGIDGAMCDFYGTGYNASTDAQRGVCDKLAAAAAANAGTFSFMEQVDDGSWKWQCDTTTKPTGWSTLGYTNLEACVEAILEQDLSYFSANYYNNGGYYTVNGRPVVAYFVDETNPQEAMGSTAWTDLWTTVKAWAVSHGNPYFVFENDSSGSPFINFMDGSFGWPQPSDGSGWQSGTYLDNFYNVLRTAAFSVKMGTAYKGFNDTLASWSANRIIDQQCGQVWSNDIWSEPAVDGFGTGSQLQSVLIATWNDYEEGTEIETGIDNCLSISASATTSTLSWNVSGQTNTLDHYTAYISIDGQNLAVLRDNIPPSVNSLDLTQYNIPAGTYALYVQAVGKPSIVNHMSNAATFTVSAPTSTVSACTQPVFNSGAVSVTTTTPGGAYTMTCDFGFNGSGITVTAGSGQCTYSKFNGTQAVFNCTAGTATGTFQNFCRVGNWNTLNYCAATDTVASLTVLSLLPASTVPLPVATTTPGIPSGTTSGSATPSSGAGGGGGGSYVPPPISTTPGTNSEALLQSLLQELQALIKQFNAQIAESFTRNLAIGSTGSDVMDLQLFLNDNGYPIAASGPGSSGDESIYFGPKTAAALMKFQTAHGLPATGYFGKLTQALLKTEFSATAASE